MRERLAVLMPQDAQDCAVHSFHSLGLAILRAHAAVLRPQPGCPRRRRAGTRHGARGGARRDRQQSPAAAEGRLRAEAFRCAGQRRGRRGAGRLPPPRLAQNWVDFDDLVGLPEAIMRRTSPSRRCGADGSSISASTSSRTWTRCNTGCSPCWPRPDGNICAIGGPEPGDLWLPRRGCGLFRTLRPGFPDRAHGPARPQLPLHRHDRDRGDPGDRRRVTGRHHPAHAGPGDAARRARANGPRRSS